MVTFIAKYLTYLITHGMKMSWITIMTLIFGKAMQSSQIATTPRVLTLEKTLLALAPALKENIFAPDLLMD